MAIQNRLPFLIKELAARGEEDVRREQVSSQSPASLYEPFSFYLRAISEDKSPK
jgi:hypothetical protein